MLSEVVNGLLLPTLAALCRKVRQATAAHDCITAQPELSHPQRLLPLQWHVPGHVAGAGILALGNCLPNTVTSDMKLRAAAEPAALTAAQVISSVAVLSHAPSLGMSTILGSTPRSCPAPRPTK